MTNQYEQKILEFISEELLGGSQDSTLKSEDDLLVTELIDSIGVVRLLAYLDETFGMTIPPEDVTIENFISVDAMCAYLTKLRDGTV